MHITKIAAAAAAAVALATPMAMAAVSPAQNSAFAVLSGSAKEISNGNFGTQVKPHFRHISPIISGEGHS